jgi:hypothetical protein
MQKRKVFISRAIILTFVGVVLLGIILVDAAKAGKSPPLNVSLGLPSPVNFGQTFNISITVTNQTNLPININKVAVGYALEMLRFRGPYEVSFTPVAVPAFGTTTFTVPFRLLYGSNSVVGMVVILARDEYTDPKRVNNEWYGAVGSAFGGVKVN